MGMFGIAEVLVNMETISSFEILKRKIGNFFPTLSDWMQSKGAILRGTVIGFFIGLLPGGNAVVASFLSYTIEKRISKEPERFGKGAIEGVAGPESANNAATAGGLVPLFTLGLPTSVVMALLFGALLIHGIRPGPFLLRDNPDLFWGVISSMYIGNLMLLVLNLPLIPVWVQVLKVPARILYPLILLFCIVGCYSVNDSVFDLVIMMIFGLVGYLFKKFQYEAAPLLLAFILGPMVEKSLRLSLTISQGSLLIFFTRPISAVLVSIAIILFVTSFLSYLAKMKGRRQGAC